MKEQHQQQLAKSDASEWQAACTALNQLDLAGLTSQQAQQWQMLCAAWVQAQAFQRLVRTQTTRAGATNAG